MAFFLSVLNLNSKRDSRECACPHDTIKANAPFRDPGLPESKIVGGRPISASSLSDDCFHLASRWLCQCLNSHRSNSRQDQDPYFSSGGYKTIMQNPDPSQPTKPSHLQALTQNFMPSRTIDVGPSNGSKQPRLVCHKIEEHDGPEEWITLSHCWGGSSPLKTTLSSFAERLKVIPPDTMPSTFRDAVVITRKLGVRHLWIDSLCIIQDSPEDWKSEATRMAGVYKYGLLNIAANTASTCHDGIFSNRIRPLAPVKLPLRSRKHNINSYMYVRSGRWDMCRNAIEESESTLSSRAWVLQESLLSPRTLHYAKQQMLWECIHHTFCECSIFPIATISISNKLALSRWVSNKMVLPTSFEQQSDHQPDKGVKFRADSYDLWFQIISKYTQRKLTYQSDIFAAIAGVASVLQDFLGDRYLAGLFEGDLLRGLLWRLENPSLAASTSSSQPSWSWASATGGVRPEIAINSSMIAPRIVGKLTAQVLNAETYLANELLTPANHFLDVSGGQIKLKGYLLRGSSLAKLCYMGDPPDPINGDSASPTKGHALQTSLHLGLVEDLDRLQDVALLHVGIWEWRFGLPLRPNMEMEFAGVVLRAMDSARSLYHRIGIAVLKANLLENETVVRFQEEAERLIMTEWEQAIVTIA